MPETGLRIRSAKRLKAVAVLLVAMVLMSSHVLPGAVIAAFSHVMPGEPALPFPCAGHGCCCRSSADCQNGCCCYPELSPKKAPHEAPTTDQPQLDAAPCEGQSPLLSSQTSPSLLPQIAAVSDPPLPMEVRPPAMPPDRLPAVSPDVDPPIPRVLPIA